MHDMHICMASSCYNGWRAYAHSICTNMTFSCLHIHDMHMHAWHRHVIWMTSICMARVGLHAWHHRVCICSLWHTFAWHRNGCICMHGMHKQIKYINFRRTRTWHDYITNVVQTYDVHAYSISINYYHFIHMNDIIMSVSDYRHVYAVFEFHMNDIVMSVSDCLHMYDTIGMHVWYSAHVMLSQTYRVHQIKSSRL